MADVKDILLEDGEPHPPRVRGTVEKFVENYEDYTYHDDRGDLCVDVDRSLDFMVYYRWCQWLNRESDDTIWDFLRNDEHSDEFEEVVRSYVKGNEEILDRIKEISYWTKDGAILINVKEAEEQGGIEQLIEEHGVRELAETAYEGSQSVEDNGSQSEGNGDSGSEDQTSFGESQFPDLYGLGVVDDDGLVVESKFRGLFVAYLKDVDEIRGEKEEPNAEAAKWGFLEWGYNKFGREWIDLLVKYISKDPLGHTANYVLDNKDEMAELIKEKYVGNQEVGVGKAGADDLVKAFLDDKAPDWDKNKEEDEDDNYEDHWDKYEQESSSSEEGGSNVWEEDDGDGGDDSPTEVDKNPGTLGEWAEAEGSADEVEKPASSTGGPSVGSEGSSGGSDRPYPIEWPDVERMDGLEKDKVYEGNTFEWAMKLPEDSVDVMVTSPPYYALRDYEVEDRAAISGDWTCDHEYEDNFCTKCGAFYGQLGREPNPALFVDHIVDLMERYREVLKPTGSLWLNIGDTYAGESIDGRVSAEEKSRMMVPERVYRRMVERGWVLRDYVIWAKKVWMPDDEPRGNGKPFSGSSRLADQWEPMVRFSPSSDPHTDVDSNRLMPPSFSGDMGKAAEDSKFRDGEDTRRGKTYNPMGTNPPDVWLINSDGYRGDHRAVFPEELAKRCVKLTAPDKVCERCGKPYDKEVKVENEQTVSPGGDYAEYQQRCKCRADSEPGTVFDPFLGSGTTGLAAAEEGLHWAGAELSEKYADLARDRIPDTRATGLGQWT